MTAIQFSQPGQLKALPPLSLYIHLPWCVQKCPYCDFNSHTAKAENDQERYVDALLADLASELPHVWGRPVETIFIGGGTPSLFSAASINRLLAGVRALVRVQPAAEITLEANPGTFEREKFEGFRDAGITRLSIGVQSFNDACLKKLGRIHNSGEALAAIETALHLFERVNIDLMYALPGQDVAGALADVQTSLATGVSHISAYHLTMEPNTPFGHTPPPDLPADETAQDIEDAVQQALQEAGFIHYETSAFAKNGHFCRHNLNYWQFGDYLGIGAGAHSKISFPDRVVRQVRWRDPATYMDKAAAGQALSNEHEVDLKARAFEFMMNALRLKDGFELLRFTERTGLTLASIQHPLAEAEAKGLLARDLARVWPTARGFDFLSDLQALFLPD